MHRRAATLKATLAITLLVVLAGVSVPAYAQTVDIHLAWDPSPEPDVAHYKIHVGTSPGAHNVLVQEVPASQPNFLFVGVPGTLYYFAVSAVNDAGVEGPLSEEISGSAPILNQLSDRTSTVGVPIVPLYLFASDPDGGTLRFSHSGLPLGLSIDSSTGDVTGIPTLVGTFDVTIFVSDGVLTAVQSFAWTVRTPGSGDTAAPALVITSHVDGQMVVSPNITVTGTATDEGLGDSGITNVWVNGVQAAGGTTSGNGIATWSRSLTLSLSNQVLVEAQDGEGNYSAKLLTLVRDVMAPVLTITSHTTGQLVSASSITLSGTATDQGMGGNGVTDVTVNGAPATSGTAEGSAVANWSRTVSLVNGSNPLTVVAADPSGNRRTVSITIIRDTTLPALTITSHFSGQTLTTGTGTITLTGTATDNGAGGNGITGVVVNGATASGGAASGSSTANWSRTVTLSIGTNAFTISTADGAGNVRTTTVTLTYTPPAIVTADGISPSSGSGMSQTFAVRYSSNLGATNISAGWVWFNFNFASSSANSCLLYYDRPNDTLRLLSDDGAVWMPGRPGTGGALQNSRCSVALGSSSAVANGNTLTLNVAMTFTSMFTGLKNVYAYAANASGVNSGWQAPGSWGVTGSGSGSGAASGSGSGSGGSAPASPPASPPPTGPATVTADAATPNSGSGATQTFALRYSDTLGASDLSTAWVWFNGTFATVSNNSCLAYYDRAAAVLYLLNDGASTWMPGTLGSGATLQNSQCTVNLGGSSATLSGNSLTLNLAMTFNPSYAGTKNIYMYAQNASSVVSGWQTRGAWTVTGSASASGPAVVTADSATPSGGSGAAQTFALQYSDTRGATDLVRSWVWFNATLASVSSNSCLVYYDRAAAVLYLLDDGASIWMAGTLGSGVTLQNSQCTVRLANSYATQNGNTLTLNLMMTFKSTFAGPKNIYMYAQNASGVNSGWQTRGAWTAQ